MPTYFTSALNKIQEKLQVADICSSNSIFGDTCTQSMTDTTKGKNICMVAWNKFGYADLATSRLPQESPFGDKNAILCQF